MFESQQHVKTEVTTIVNTETNEVTVLSSEVVRPQVETHVRVIPVAILPIVEKKFTEIREIRTTIETSIESSVVYESMTVKDLKEVKVYNTIVKNPTTEEKVQYVFVYNKKSGVVT